MKRYRKRGGYFPLTFGRPLSLARRQRGGMIVSLPLLLAGLGGAVYAARKAAIKRALKKRRGGFR